MTLLANLFSYTIKMMKVNLEAISITSSTTYWFVPAYPRALSGPSARGNRASALNSCLAVLVALAEAVHPSRYVGGRGNFNNGVLLGLTLIRAQTSATTISAPLISVFFPSLSPPTDLSTYLLSYHHISASSILTWLHFDRGFGPRGHDTTQHTQDASLVGPALRLG